MMCAGKESMLDMEEQMSKRIEVYVQTLSYDDESCVMDVGLSEVGREKEPIEYSFKVDRNELSTVFQTSTLIAAKQNGKSIFVWVSAHGFPMITKVEL